MSGVVRDAGYDDLLDAIEGGEAYYLECPNEHGSLPPRWVCPHCGDPELIEEPLPDTGEIKSFTVVHVTTPAFVDDAPYVTAIADFGPVRLTGQLRSIAPKEVSLGAEVTSSVAETETSGERLLAFDRR